MFETTVVRDRVVARRKAGLLTMSLAAHTLVVAGIVAASVSSVSFPRRAPNELAAFNPIPIVSLPPPLGSRNAAPRVSVAHPQPAPPSHVLPAPQTPITTPSTIPSNAIPAQPGSDSTIGSDGGDSQPYGDPNGEANGIDLGQPASPDAIGVPAMTYVPGGEVIAARVLRRVEPEYPRVALVSRTSGVVVLRCIVDSRGEVRDPTVVTSSFAAFDEPALTALKQWRFAPGSYRGNKVDTWFELTIRFTPR